MSEKQTTIRIETGGTPKPPTWRDILAVWWRALRDARRLRR